MHVSYYLPILFQHLSNTPLNKLRARERVFSQTAEKRWHNTIKVVRTLAVRAYRYGEYRKGVANVRACVCV